MILLLGSALGRRLGWEGQQDGRLVHDILPTRGREDAFHPGRAHYDDTTGLPIAMLYGGQIGFLRTNPASGSFWPSRTCHDELVISAYVGTDRLRRGACHQR